MPMQIRRTATPNLPPTGLAEGQLGVEMASTPPRLWAGVPIAVDPSGRRLLIPSSVPSGATNPVTANAGDFFFNTTTGNLMYYDGAAWQQVLFDAPSDGNLWGRRDGAWSSVAIPEVPDPSVSVVPLGGHLGIVGSSPSPSIRYLPFNGGWIRVNGQDYALPSTGISAGTTNVFIDGVAGQNLANNTFYYVYVFDSAGTLTLDFSTTGHETSVAANNTGIEIKQADNTRTLLGIVYVLNNQFYDQLDSRLVRSWYNRGTTAFLASGNTSASSGAWGTTLVIVRLVCFENETIIASVNGTWTGTGATIGFGYQDNGVLANYSNLTVPTGQTCPASFGAVRILTVGNHNLVMVVATSPTPVTGTGSLAGTI